MAHLKKKKDYVVSAHHDIDCFVKLINRFSLQSASSRKPGANPLEKF